MTHLPREPSDSRAPVVLMRRPGSRFATDAVRRRHAAIDIGLARAQHADVQSVYRELGAEVRALEPLDDLPDSVFIEDVALILDGHALLLRSRVPSRAGEAAATRDELEKWCKVVHPPPGPFMDGGDCLVTDRDVFVGINNRTDPAASTQLTPFAGDRVVSQVDLRGTGFLHLKSAVTHLGRSTLLVRPDFPEPELFRGYQVLTAHADEGNAANCVAFGGSVIMADGYPRTRRLVEGAGFDVRVVAISEFERADGSVSCLSLIISQS